MSDEPAKLPAVDLSGRVTSVSMTGQVTFWDSKPQMRYGQLQCSDDGTLSVKVDPPFERKVFDAPDD